MTSFKIIFIILQIHYSVGNRGHFVNLLQFPGLCPLTSFCAPWNPSKSSLILIQHQKIELSVHDIYYLDNNRGRLKDDISCWIGSEQQNSTEWCQLFSDTGYVQCNSKNTRGNFPTDDRNEKFRYMVPKSCVEWKSDSDHMTPAFYSQIQLKIPIFGSPRNEDRSTQVIISLDKVQISDKHSTSMTWRQLMKKPITRGITTLTGHKNKILLIIDGILSLEILPTKQHGNICLYMKIRALHKFWDWPLDPNKIATSEELNGLLGQSGFLEALYIAKLNSDLDSDNNQLSYKSDFGCKAVAWYSFRIPLCPCQLARMRNIPLPFNEKVRIQHCCDYWLGRAMQGEGKGILAHGLQRQIFYNDRLACAQGLKPKNDYDGSCDDSYCCSKTHSQVAEWNFRVRGKCHVLRSLRKNKVKSELEKKEEELEERAYFRFRVAIGLMITVFSIIIAFNFINAKLEECRAKVLVGNQ